MQTDLLTEFLPSVGCKNLITTVVFFLSYTFADLASNPTVVNTAKVIHDTKTRHAYLRTLMVTDKDSIFFSILIHEIAEVLGITLRYERRSMHKPLASCGERMPH